MGPRILFSIMALGLIAAMSSFTSSDASQPRGSLDGAAVTAVERDQRCALSPGEVAVLAGPGGPAPSLVAEGKGIFGRTMAGGERFTIIEVGLGAGIDFGDSSIAPVFRSGSGPMASFLFPTGEVIVQFKLRVTEKQAASWARARGLDIVRALRVADSFLLRAANPSESLAAAARGAASEQVLFCAPNWMRQASLRQEDPLYPDQWHLKNTGQVEGTVAGNDLNAESVWPTYRGSAAQVICVVDDGLEIGHRDLAANVVPGLSWDFIRKQADPTAGEHGTAVGGVAAARGFNGIGVRGVAPEAGLCGYRLLGEEKTDAEEAEAETRAYDRISVYNNSWGPDDTGYDLGEPGPLTKAAITEGVTRGRGGKGAIYVWAGGNGRPLGDNSNYDGYANWRYTIAVGASTSGGCQARYSESGANLCVNAPSNGGADTGIATVDRTGVEGYNYAGEEQGDFADLDFTNSFGGTSSATPAVSGVCALLLQANPDLGWRDVRKILMATAYKNDPNDADWTANAAGYHVNHKYGFGRADAAAAVIAAAAWTTLAPEVSAEGSALPGRAIPLGSQGVSSTIALDRSIVVESVEVYFTADHSNWGDLSVILTAPSGTSSALAEQHDTLGSRTRYDNWRFGSERHLGEVSAGDWTLTVRDLGTIGGGTFANWKLVVYGTDPDATSVTLTTVVSPAEWGSVSPAGTTRLYRGVAAGIRATAAAGDHFTEWTASPEGNVTFGFGGRKAEETTVTLSGDATLTARFSAVPPETAAVDFAVFPKWGGFMDPGERATVNLGAGLAVNALPAAGCTFVKWEADPASNAQFASAGSASTIARISGNVKITAVFRGPDVNLTQGSVIKVPASDLDIPSFTKAPKVTGAAGGKSYAMKVIGQFPSETVTAEWPGKPRIYDPADYKSPVRGLGVLLEDQPMAPVRLQSLLIDATKADGARLDYVEMADCALAPPVITQVKGDLSEGSELELDGSFFGTKPPTVRVEYVKNGKYAYKACTLIREFYFEDARGNPSCMMPSTGMSAVKVVYPALPPGAEPTGYLILESPIGMCSFYPPPPEEE